MILPILEYLHHQQLAFKDGSCLWLAGFVNPITKSEKGWGEMRWEGRGGEERRGTNFKTFHPRLSFQITTSRSPSTGALSLVVRDLPCTSWSSCFLSFNMISRFLVRFWVKSGSPEIEKGTMVSLYCSKSITLAGSRAVEKLMPLIRRYMRPRSASNCNSSSFQLRQENTALLMSMARNCWAQRTHYKREKAALQWSQILMEVISINVFSCVVTDVQKEEWGW